MACPSPYAGKKNGSRADRGGDRGKGAPGVGMGGQPAAGEGGSQAWTVPGGGRGG